MPDTEDATVPEGEAAEECDNEDILMSNEPPMYIERPSSARSQDVTHILVRTFRDIFTRDAIAPDTIQYLNTSRCTDDEDHQLYVDALLKVTVAESHSLQIWDYCTFTSCAVLIAAYGLEHLNGTYGNVL